MNSLEKLDPFQKSRAEKFLFLYLIISASVLKAENRTQIGVVSNLGFLVYQHFFFYFLKVSILQNNFIRFRSRVESLLSCLCLSKGV